MKTFFKLVVLFVGVCLAASCSGVKFNKSQKDVCLGSDNNCNFNPSNNTVTFDYEMTVPALDNRVDIIFIDDNSKSMMKDQQQLASRFGSFMSYLQNFDWQIGITTTDMRTGSQPYMGGKLVPFTDSNYNPITNVLNKSVQSYAALFGYTIQRKETMDCIWYYDHGQPWNCDLNGDERGIYAAITLLQTNPSGVMRSGVPVHFVNVSNEDERSYGGSTEFPLIKGVDEPQDFVTTSNKVGKAGAKFHSIIIRPGDQACLNSERSNSYNDAAQTGNVYAALSNLTGGFIGSICENDYSNMLQAIGKSIGDGTLDTIRDLPCTPNDGFVKLYVPSTNTAPFIISNVTGRSFSVNPPIAPNTKVRLVFTCDTMP